MKKIGNITKERGAEPTDNDISAALFLIDQGFDVKFLRANRIKGSHTPDIEMNNEKWEIKTPRKNGKYTIEHLIRDGLNQSPNIIFDLRKSKSRSESSIRQKIGKQFKMTKKWRKLIVITKSAKMLTFAK